MRFARTASEATDVRKLTGDLIAGVSGRVGSGADLAALFFTGHLTELAEELTAELERELGPKCLIGVSCESVAGGDVEIEQRPGAALLVGSLPGVELRPFHIAAGEWKALLADEERLQQRVGTGEEHRGQLLLADPFTTPIDVLLPRLDALLHRPTFGGMASAGQRPGSNLLLLNGESYRDGAVGIGFGGPVEIALVVSQGCRPIGPSVVVTRSEANAVLELGRRPALEVAQEILNDLSASDAALLENGLFVGVVINEYQESFHRGDFLVRGLMGADRKSGALVVADEVRPGQTIQFHVRDAVTAHEDLTELLRGQADLPVPSGGLLFSCNGRGSRMFPQPHHDIRTTHQVLGEAPVAGFFAMGELGPVGGKSFIHGHTASLALFRPAIVGQRSGASGQGGGGSA